VAPGRDAVRLLGPGQWAALVVGCGILGRRAAELAARAVPRRGDRGCGAAERVPDVLPAGFPPRGAGVGSGPVSRAALSEM
jgi:hypothetical protein